VSDCPEPRAGCGVAEQADQCGRQCRRVCRDEHACLAWADQRPGGGRARSRQAAPARTAINAGLDLVMYAETESAATGAYRILSQDLRSGTLSASRVEAAAAKIRALKQSLGLL
jgi:hypothetical protein